MRLARWLSVLVAVGAAFGPLLAPGALAQEFYAGKTINFIVGYTAGGGYDIYTRAIARHITRHIPGNPTSVVQNMPGAGSGTAAAYIYSIAPKDGTVIGSVSPGAIVGPLLDPKIDARYDATKFVYLGTADSGTRTCITLKSSGISSFEEARQKRVVVGAVAPGSSTSDYAWLHKKTSGANFEIVTGYPGSAEIMLAMERGEVDAICGLDWASFKAQKPDWIRDNKIHILVQAGLEPHLELSKMGVPQIWDFVEGETNRKIVELIVSQQIFGRPYIFPPGTSEVQVKILRKAFETVLSDSHFLAEVEKSGLSLSPAGGEEVQRAVIRAYGSPKDIVEQARRAIVP